MTRLDDVACLESTSRFAIANDRLRLEFDKATGDWVSMTVDGVPGSLITRNDPGIAIDFCVDKEWMVEEHGSRLLETTVHLDEAEVAFPFDGMVEFTELETEEKLVVDADGARREYLEAVQAFREDYRRTCFHAGIDYVPLDTSMQFDRALMEYLVSRRNRF